MHGSNLDAGRASANCNPPGDRPGARAGPLVVRCVLALLAAGAVFTLCVLFVDRPLALWVHERGIDRSGVLRWITLLPPVAQTWSPLLIATLLLRRAWGPFHPWERALFAAAVAIIVAEQVTESLRPVFGRSWPKTWIDNNPALIPGGVYAFHPLDASVADGDCPSGHSARTLSVVAVAWVAWPRWPVRLAGTMVATLVVVALVGMDYHFLGDCILGGTLGALVGVAAAEVAGLRVPEDRQRRPTSSLWRKSSCLRPALFPPDGPAATCWISADPATSRPARLAATSLGLGDRALSPQAATPAGRGSGP